VERLPVHGFVLAGGRSSRMGVDKATLEFRGRPMVDIAVEKLRMFCFHVSISGNRPDLSTCAEVVAEARVHAGPAAGIEAGLLAARQAWALFVPVDVPRMPAEILHCWALEPQASYLVCEGQAHPAFCLLPTHCAAQWSQSLTQTGRLLALLHSVGAVSRSLGRSEDFANLNEPRDLLLAEELAKAEARPK
jgi:molybdopterin-guanine dinucleotide biosynthesis protein A